MTEGAESADLDLCSCFEEAAVVQQPHNAAAVDSAVFEYAEGQGEPVRDPMQIYGWKVLRR